MALQRELWLLVTTTELEPSEGWQSLALHLLLWPPAGSGLTGNACSHTSQRTVTLHHLKRVQWAGPFPEAPGVWGWHLGPF